MQGQPNHEPLGQVIRSTTVIEPQRLSSALGVNLTIASEVFQVTGSFKFRAAYNLASKVPARRFIAASSGNFGQALAHACQLLQKTCIIVMPDTSAKAKIAGVQQYGGQIDLIDVKTKSRCERVAELARDCPDAYVASAYDDPLVIEGNASLGVEIAALNRQFDCVTVPIGGGGLASGIITGLRTSSSNVPVIGAEPLMGNDAARSLKAGHIVANETEPLTIADGARTLSVGAHNWRVLRNGIARIIEVPEEKIVEGVRLFFELANLKVEPTGALGLGGILTELEAFQGLSVCCVVSGGNVDLAAYRSILAG